MNINLKANLKNPNLILFFILFIAVYLNLFSLNAIGLWHDEAFSMLLTRYDFKEMLHRIGLDVHPPFYYIVLMPWNFLFGNSLFSLRAFSAFAAILMILGVYLLVKEIFQNKKLALLSAALTAFSSFQIQYAREGRMYALGTFLIVFSSYFLVKALKSKKYIFWVLYALFAICAIYTHYYIFFSIAAQFLFIVYLISQESKLKLSKLLKNQNLKFSLISYIFIGISYIPWLNIFLRQISQVQESYWIPKMNKWSIPATFLKMTLGGNIDAPKYWHIVLGSMLIIIAAIFYALKKYKASEKYLIFLLLIIPFIGASLLSLKTAIYLDRYFIFVLPFYLILMSGAVFTIKNARTRNSLIFFTILFSFISFPIYWNNLSVKQKPGMAVIAEYLNQQVQPNHKIYVGSSFIYFTFKANNKTNINPLLYAPNALAHFSGTALLNPEDIIKDFNSGVQKQDIVWMLNTTGFGNYRPDIPNNWQKLEEKSAQDAAPIRGWIIATKYLVQ